ncbi:MAG: hypothetical protein HC902_00560 [Calothrix sp. SM1_5_4]|nr:hypothetical protein [Calothrix sp. SM1_5_4]
MERFDLKFRQLFQIIILLLTTGLVALLFQNCGQGFEAAKDLSSSRSSDSDGGGLTDDGGSPTKAPQIPSIIKKISASTYHSCAITAQDTVKCWGGNYSGQLGNNTTMDSLIPVDAVVLTGI